MFTNQDCSLPCPYDNACKSKSILYESGVCFCSSCPVGSAVITHGPNAGICKSCGIDCKECDLNDAKTDVECVTCSTGKQWLSVSISGTKVIGCYG